MTFTDNETNLIVNALYVAAEEYRLAARKCQELVDGGLGGHERTVAQFNQQEKEARELAEKIEQGN
jgi:hypothetical protein